MTMFKAILLSLSKFFVLCFWKVKTTVWVWLQLFIVCYWKTKTALLLLFKFFALCLCENPFLEQSVVAPITFIVSFIVSLSWIKLLFIYLLGLPWFGVAISVRGFWLASYFKDTFVIMQVLGWLLFLSVLGWYYVRHNFWPSLEGAPYKLPLYYNAYLNFDGLASRLQINFIVFAAYMWGFYLAPYPYPAESSHGADWGVYKRTKLDRARSNRGALWIALFLGYRLNTLMDVCFFSESEVALAWADYQLHVWACLVYFLCSWVLFKYIWFFDSMRKKPYLPDYMLQELQSQPGGLARFDIDKTKYRISGKTKKSIDFPTKISKMRVSDVLGTGRR